MPTNADPNAGFDASAKLDGATADRIRNTDATGDPTNDIAKNDGPAESPAEPTISAADEQYCRDKRRVPWLRIMAFGILPSLAMLLGMSAGYLKWQEATARNTALARSESVRAAMESTVVLLSYKPDTVEKDLTAARNRLTGGFRDSYDSLVKNVVVPGAKQKKISAVATVPAAASVSATPYHAVVLAFVNQSTIIGEQAPTNTISTIRVVLEKTGADWLISDFTPV